MVRQRRIRWSFVTPLLTLFLAFSLVAPTLTLARQSADSEVHGINPADMDFSVDPAEDFYRFANGGWLDRTEIPADEGAYGVFNELDDLTTEQLLDLLGGLTTSSNLQEGTDEWKAVQLFAQGTDLGTRDAQGIEPIQPILDEVDAITSLDELHAFQEGAGFRWLTGLFYTFVIPDLQDSSINAPYLSGPWFGLPNRDYYLEDDEGNAEVREAYVQACAELLGYAGYDGAAAEAAAQAVYDLERTLVEPTLTLEEQQDFSLYYNPMTLDELEAVYPLMDWQAYVQELGLTSAEQLIVSEKRYLESLDQIVTAADLDVLKDWIKLEVLWSFADFLGSDIEQTAFEFQGGVLGGVTEQEPIEERVLGAVNGMVGDAIGQLYVAEYFPPEAKDQINDLVDAIVEAFRLRLEANPWMSDEAKATALEKLDVLGVKVGYPDEWRSYEAFDLADSYAMSFLSAQNAEYRRTLDTAGQPVDPNEWDFPPQTVNAFYDQFNNAITFPAAILQPPFFDYQADPASNFGAIGFVIGHEITHGFDLQGSQFDAEGNLRSWWTEADQAAFDELNQRVAEQYGAIEVLPGINIDGQITVTENVADLGGVQVAYDALLVYLESQGETLATPSAEGSPAATPLATPVGGPEATPVGGEVALTQQQRFFVAAATVWREKIRDELLETQVRTDVHAPAEQRATVPIQHMDEFYEAFGIEPGDAMYLPPEERITIW
jgi:putative endopeptidase